jgi:hypothetical protein
VYHDYCLNYPKAVSYLEQLRKNEDFGEFEKVFSCHIDYRSVNEYNLAERHYVHEFELKLKLKLKLKLNSAKLKARLKLDRRHYVIAAEWQRLPHLM